MHHVGARTPFSIVSMRQAAGMTRWGNFNLTHPRPPDRGGCSRPASVTHGGRQAEGLGWRLVFAYAHGEAASEVKTHNASVLPCQPHSTSPGSRCKPSGTALTARVPPASVCATGHILHLCAAFQAGTAAAIPGPKVGRQPRLNEWM